MTEDMVIEDGEGSRFEPQAPQPPTPLPTPEPHPNAPQPGPAPPPLPPRPEPAQGNIVGDGGAGGFGTQPNPNNYSDLVIYLVHGTWGSPEEHWSDEFIGFLMDEFNIPRGQIHIPDWGGALSEEARRDGGLDVANQIYSNHREANSSILLVGYSHGGNVLKNAINDLDYRNFNLGNSFILSIGTPIMDVYQFTQSAYANLGFHFNAFNRWDFVQIGGTALDGNPYIPEGSFGYVNGLVYIGNGQMRHAFVEFGRWSPTAKNIQISNHIPRSPFNNYFGIPAHSAMHANPSVWRDYFLNLLLQAINGEGRCGE